MKSDYESLLRKKYILLPHKGSYLLPISYNNNPNTDTFESIEDTSLYLDRGKFNKNLETEFQISFLVLTNENIFGTKFNTFAGYTQKSFWQLYNEEWSRPFRETNYMPEFFARYDFDEPVNFFGSSLMSYDFGVVHQSNGQVQKLSRSWNRIFVRTLILSGETLFNISLWHRLEEPAGIDDNPSIHRYLGYGEIDITYKFEHENVQLKLIPGTKYLSGELAVSTPWKEGLRFYTKISHGYGLSLQDYNHKSRKVGVGIILSDPFSSQPEVK